MIDLKLPEQVFFDPTSEFLKWFRGNLALRYHTIIDAGAGVGRLSAKLQGHGLDVLAIDLHGRIDTEHDVQHDDATTRSYSDTDLVIIARPSHGGWASEAARTALDHGAMVLYIGLEHNLVEDLGDLVVQQIYTNAGGEGDGVWEVIGAPADLEEWCLIHPSFWNEPHWSHSTRHRWENEMGGGFDKIDVELEPLQCMRIQDLGQLPHWENILLDPELDSGWVTPDGRWLGCHTRSHDNVIQRITRIPLRHAEATGFVRCYGGDAYKFFVRADHKRLSGPQRRRLDEHGYVVDNEEYVRSVE